jgi:hypothetical protein
MDRFMSVKFPALNKNSSLEENDRYIAEESRTGRCKVVKTLSVPPAVFDVLGSTLLDDNGIWEEIGGCDCDDPEIEAVWKEEDKAGRNGYLKVLKDKRLLVLYRATCYSLVVEVTAAGREPFYVNTEGYKYARYVGRAA